MALYYGNNLIRPLGPEGDSKQVNRDAYREMMNKSNSRVEITDSNVEKEENNKPVNDREWNTDVLVEPFKNDEVSLEFIDPKKVEDNVKSTAKKKIILLGVGLATLMILISTLSKQIELNHQQSETLADYETQMKISKSEMEKEIEVAAERYEEANEVISQVNSGTYGSTSESQAAGENLYFFANKIALKNKNLEDISRPQLNIYFKVSKYELENKMGFTPETTVSHDEYGRNYIECAAPYVASLSGIESGKYYIESKTLAVNIPNALFTKEDGTYKAVTSDIPFVGVALENGINFDVTLTEYNSLSEYCEKEGLLPATVEGAPLNGQPTSTNNYLTAENVDAIATRAYQDPGFEVMYSPNIAGNSYSQNFYSNNFFIAETYKMKPATAYWENGNSMAFYQVGGVPRAK